MSLLADLIAQIKQDGPIPVSRYMQLCLDHYYAKGTAFGAAGDFITAPEISQIFGEVLGLWCAAVWAQMGGPDKIMLVEMGPGRGTLMSDALRAIDKVPGLPQALDLRLIERSPALKEQQRAALKGRKVRWHERLEDLPKKPMILLTNELLDALPIEQHVKTGQGWQRRMVDEDPAAPGALRFTLGETDPQAPLRPHLKNAPLDAIAETAPQAQALIQSVSARLKDQGGAALFIDYGYAESAPGDSLQAVKAHQYSPVLKEPGEADLTSHVDFQALADVASQSGAQPQPLLTQRDFLRRLGAEMRAQALIQANPSKMESVISGCQRLIDPDKMGTLFKVLALAGPTLSPLPGFEQP